MSSLDKLTKITHEISDLKKQLGSLISKRNNILLELLKKSSSKFITFNLFKNNSDILITQNDIECENCMSETDIISDDNSDEDTDK
ncbi:hypothetical protein crov180 [Cafeteria roenbergensis virus]|uniref:Uncharacterized protein n=1 Tax=Cafeteria roenbergensis virus (strain BV-PW1) TaxID=693272 RepID=E3T4V0_CROVB|nr:hypothetical protein crov180 [Cafeteria roenbergensis virus BV-PW1]ADO67213.1 hypothetical protein crov180 [Cafeteria roenbergensis virus BV-PW1]